MSLFFKHILNGDKSDRHNPSPPIEVAVEIMAWTKKTEQWFTNKDTPRAELLAECKKRWPARGPRRMRKYSDTRAANAFRVWHRALRLKDALQSVVRSAGYKAWVDRLSGEEKERAATIRAYVDDDDAWDEVTALVQALTPAYKFLRPVDGYTPTVGKIYYKCLRIQEGFTTLAESELKMLQIGLQHSWHIGSRTGDTCIVTCIHLATHLTQSTTSTAKNARQKCGMRRCVVQKGC